MAKAKVKVTPEMGVSDLVGDLLTEMNKFSTGSKAYLSGDHANHTWGVPIPHMAFQWLIGGSSILPCQRYFGLSGMEKSFKSTLKVEMGNWFIRGGGIHVDLDTENKTSPTMLDAMTWWNETNPSHRIFKVCKSISEWQTQISKAVARARELGNRPKGSRLPMYITVDSLMAASTEEADEELRKEGDAKQRGYPVANLQVTNFIETLNLLGTTTTLGWVQHMKEVIDSQGHGKQYKEKGATAAQFACSTHLRMSKANTQIHLEKHPSAPFEGCAIEGHDIYMRTARSCVGPGDRRLTVQLLWQHVPQEDGTTRQAMWYDWDGALGKMLCDMKYDKNFKPKVFGSDKKRLEEALQFTLPKANRVKCLELELEEASFTEFGRAIEAHPEVRTRIANLLNIKSYPTVQDADIDFDAGNLDTKKKK